MHESCGRFHFPGKLLTKRSPVHNSEASYRKPPPLIYRGGRMLDDESLGNQIDARGLPQQHVNVPRPTVSVPASDEIPVGLNFEQWWFCLFHCQISIFSH